jgi:rhodanese-related sulfurtransferase
MFFNMFSRSSAKQISTKELKDEYLTNKKDKFFLDVRTKQEFSARKIRGFENISVDRLEQNLKKLPKDKEIVVICQSGSRSAAACNFLIRNGFENVTNVQGGMNAWRD